MKTRPTDLPEHVAGIDPQVMEAAKRHAVQLRAMAISDAIDSTARWSGALPSALRTRLLSAFALGAVRAGCRCSAAFRGFRGFRGFSG